MNLKSMFKKLYEIVPDSPYEIPLDGSDLFNERDKTKTKEPAKDVVLNANEYIVAQDVEIVKAGLTIDGNREVLEDDLRQIVNNFEYIKSKNIKPKINLGHTVGFYTGFFEQGIFTYPEKENLGYIDNVRFKEENKSVIGDFYFRNKDSVEKMLNGTWNHRSASMSKSEEVLRTEIETFYFAFGDKEEDIEEIKIEVPVYRGWWLEDCSLLSGSIPAIPDLKPYNQDMDFKTIQLSNINADKMAIITNSKDGSIIYKRMLSAPKSDEEVSMDEIKQLYEAKLVNETMKKKLEDSETQLKQFSQLKADNENLTKLNDDYKSRLETVNKQVDAIEVQKKEFTIEKAIKDMKFAPYQEEMLEQMYANSNDKKIFYKMIDDTPPRKDITSLTVESVKDKPAVTKIQQDLLEDTKTFMTTAERKRFAEFISVN
jgi:hypothetical protein